MSFRKKSWHQQVKELSQMNIQLQRDCRAFQYLYFNSVRTNKKNLEYFKKIIRAQEPCLEELEDK